MMKYGVNNQGLLSAANTKMYYFESGAEHDMWYYIPNVLCTGCVF